MNISFELTKKAKLIIVEEAQFFIDLVVFVKSMVDYEDKNMVVVGLDGDYNRKPFGQLLECIPLADKVTKLTSLCSRCADGTPALFSYRKNSAVEQVCVGGKDEYIPLCRKCFLN
jgi:thymidine kinase